MLLFVPSYYEVVSVAASSVRYGCTIVMSHTGINKVVSQWPLTLTLCTHNPEIIDIHRSPCDKLVNWDSMTLMKLHCNAYNYSVSIVKMRCTCMPINIQNEIHEALLIKMDKFNPNMD